MTWFPVVAVNFPFGALLGACEVDSMKPRIKLIKSIWYCWTPGVTGMGYTAKSAYNDWSNRK